MLSMVISKEIAEEDTPENREQAYYDMAYLTENMIMRNRTHGGYKVLVDELWEFCEKMNADMVMMWEHMSCKALVGMHGQFEEQARERGITSSGSATTCAIRACIRVRPSATSSTSICVPSCARSRWIRPSRFCRTRTHGDEGGESMNLKRLSLKLLGGAGGFFAVTFLIYFFNLDMKFLSSCVEPILLRHYDRIPRKHYI